MSRLMYAIEFTGQFDAMREFYSERVGLRIRHEEPRWVEFDTAGAILALHEMRDEARQGVALRFETDEAGRRAMEARGAPPCVPVEATQGRFADLRDPEGNLLQLIEPRRPGPAGDGPRIERVILNVHDFPRAVSFYRGPMGFRMAAETEH